MGFRVLGEYAKEDGADGDDDSGDDDHADGHRRR